MVDDSLAEPALADLLAVRPVGVDQFAAPDSVPGRMGIYGGQLIAQAVNAAVRTVEHDRVLHSLHAYFLSRGRPDEELIYDVARERDGRSYSARRVTATQEGKLIFSMALSFARADQGVRDEPDAQAVGLPDVAPPEDARRIETHLLGIEVRDPAPPSGLAHPTRVWFRCEE
ncbi:MAG: acyl-CoA thioesterase, partial [Frankiales bacterium]|nr:acyl-CoA thioesterase [Frankiales bacterium]